MTACAASTEAAAAAGGPAPAAADAVGFDAGRPYELHPQVALRNEPFGALAYHYGNRRLTFLRSVELVGIVESLAEHDTAAAAVSAAGVVPGRRPAVLAALASLQASEVIRAR